MDYEIIYSKRKTMSLQISRDCKIIARAPFGVSRDIIDKFVEKHSAWIFVHLEKRKMMNLRHPEPTDDELLALKKRAYEYLPKRVAHFVEIMGVSPSKVSINSAKTRFGSCSAKGNINFSCRLMQYPDEAIDYVVVHELSHLKHLNHSKSFWAFVEKFLPDYKERKRLLK